MYRNLFTFNSGEKWLVNYVSPLNPSKPQTTVRPSTLMTNSPLFCLKMTVLQSNCSWPAIIEKSAYPNSFENYLLNSIVLSRVSTSIGYYNYSIIKLYYLPLAREAAWVSFDGNSYSMGNKGKRYIEKIFKILKGLLWNIVWCIHASQMMKSTDVSDPLTFPPVLF